MAKAYKYATFFPDSASDAAVRAITMKAVVKPEVAAKEGTNVVQFRTFYQNFHSFCLKTKVLSTACPVTSVQNTWPKQKV